MAEVILKRYRREGGHDKKYYLSLLSLDDYSISEICSLTEFEDHSQIHGSRCGDWLCFHNCLGKFTLYHIPTKQVRSLPPYKSPLVKNRSWNVIDNGYGIGYDHLSDDYKVVRSYSLYKPDTAVKVCSEVYSLKNGTLKEIPNDCPYAFYSIDGGIYTSGCFYWVVDNLIQCFDFSTETYSYIHAPPCGDKNFEYHVVDHCGTLGVIAGTPTRKFSEHWARPRLDTKTREGEEEECTAESSEKKRSKKRSFELWVSGGTSWIKLYDASLHHVVKPLCLIDGRISLFQGKTHKKECDLVIYDWATKEMKLFDVRDYPGHLEVYSGVQAPLASQASTRIYNEEEDTTPAFLRPCVAACGRDEAKPMDTGLDDEVPAERRRRSRRRSRKQHRDEGVALPADADGGLA